MSSCLTLRQRILVNEALAVSERKQKLADAKRLADIQRSLDLRPATKAQRRNAERAFAYPGGSL
jgi:hypothetical protein